VTDGAGLPELEVAFVPTNGNGGATFVGADTVMKMNVQPIAFLPLSLTSDLEYSVDALFTLVHEAQHYEQLLYANWFYASQRHAGTDQGCTSNPARDAIATMFTNRRTQGTNPQQYAAVTAFEAAPIATAIANHPTGLHRARMCFWLKAYEACDLATVTDKILNKQLPKPPDLPDTLSFKLIDRFANAEIIGHFYTHVIAARATLAAAHPSDLVLAIDPPAAVDRSNPDATEFTPTKNTVTSAAGSKAKYTWYNNAWVNNRASHSDWTSLYNYEFGYVKYMYWSVEENNAYSVERHFERLMRAALAMAPVTTPWELRRLKFLA